MLGNPTYTAIDINQIR